MMHDHDLDLIASYADGTLADDEARRAADLVATCTECAGEYELQRGVASALGAAPAVSMTAAERQDLHRRVMAMVEPAPVVSLDHRRRFRPNWVAMGTAAAALIAVVGIGGALTGGFGGGTAADLTAGAESAAAPAPQGAPEAALANNQSPRVALDSSSEDASGVAAGSVTTMAAATADQHHLGILTLDELSDEIRSRATTSKTTYGSPPPPAACDAKAPTIDSDWFTAQVDGVEIIVFVPVDGSPAAAFVTDGCEVYPLP